MEGRPAKLVFFSREWPLCVTQTLRIWEPCLALADVGLPGALTGLSVNALGFLGSPGPLPLPSVGSFCCH